MYERFMSPEERAEYDTVIEEVLNGNRMVDDDKVRLYQKLLNDAAQAQRPWAPYVLNLAQMAGLRSDLKGKAKQESVVVIDYRGQKVGKSVRLGRKQKDAAGRTHFQQTLLQDFSWDELQDWLDMIERQIGGLLVNRHIARRLLSLHEQFPESRGPAEACTELGTTVEDFLATEEDGKEKAA